MSNDEPLDLDKVRKLFEERCNQVNELNKHITLKKRI